VGTVGPGVLGVLADEGARLLADGGVGNARQGLPGGRDDVPLECDGGLHISANVYRSWRTRNRPRCANACWRRPSRS
jgi:hypothetical protein